MCTALSTAALASSAGCLWTEFDDLQKETWVLSIEKPSVDSADYGVAIQRGDNGPASGSSGTLAVIGAADATYSELAFDSNGSSSLQSNSLELNELGIQTLDPSPILLASPTSAEIALVTTGNNDSIVVATGTHTLLLSQLFVKQTTLETTTTSSTPTAATYMQAVKHPAVTDPPPPQPLVAAGDVVMGTVYGLPSGTRQPACRLVDGGNAVQVRALGAIRRTAAPDADTDDVLVWATDGKLHRYRGTLFNGCTPDAPTRTPEASATISFMPGRGSQILALDGGRLLLQGHQDVAQGDSGVLQIVDSTTLAPLGNALAISGLRTATIFAIGSAQYVLAGIPTATVEGSGNQSARAGQVLIYRIPTTGGFDSSTGEIAQLHDAQPEDAQQFGRSIAVMPYNGKNVIAVAADNEIFVYFRLNLADGSELYGDTRQGR